MIIQDGVFTPGVRTNSLISQIGNVVNLNVSNCYVSNLYVNDIELNGNINISGNLTVQGITYLNEVDVSGNLTLHNLMTYSYEIVDTSGSQLSTDKIVSIINGDVSGGISVSLLGLSNVGQTKIIILQQGLSCELSVNIQNSTYSTAKFNNPGSTLSLINCPDGYFVLSNNDVTLS